MERAFSVRESGSRLSGSSPPLTSPDARSRPTHSRMSPRPSPRVIRGLIHGLHAPSLHPGQPRRSVAAAGGVPRAAQQGRPGVGIRRRCRRRQRDRRRVDQGEAHTLRHSVRSSRRSRSASRGSDSRIPRHKSWAGLRRRTRVDRRGSERGARCPGHHPLPHGSPRCGLPAEAWTRVGGSPSDASPYASSNA
jgi:hypothetical protein